VTKRHILQQKCINRLHRVTEKNITNTTCHWCRNLMTVLSKFTETHF